ncbi:MAG: adaptor protein MecA [Lachnospiraceae bacterium]|nr:adaptor protein MecA [Lachnospiraceae bacterium]
MKIEKINENQIRCFLSKEELASRQLQLKELAYGTEKARALFRELMEKAFLQYGFIAENMPVMVEAVPLHDDSLVLIITRVENPEELDTRFSNFAPSVKSGAEDGTEKDSSSILSQLIETIHRELGESPERSSEEENGSRGSGADLQPGTERSSGQERKDPPAPDSRKAQGVLHPDSQLYTFHSLGRAADAACMVPDFSGKSSLYRDPADSKYYLFLSPSEDTDAVVFSRVLSTFSEFGRSEYITPAREQYLREHCEVLCAADAVTKLTALGQN